MVVVVDGLVDNLGCHDLFAIEDESSRLDTLCGDRGRLHVTKGSEIWEEERQ